MMSDFDDLVLDDLTWWLHLQRQLRQLAENDRQQPALFPVEALRGHRRFVPCPRRGTHERLTDCWLCFGDVAWGHATPEQVLRARGEAA
jgi:hypothetical protein